MTDEAIREAFIAKTGFTPEFASITWESFKEGWQAARATPADLENDGNWRDIDMIIRMLRTYTDSEIRRRAADLLTTLRNVINAAPAAHSVKANAGGRCNGNCCGACNYEKCAKQADHSAPVGVHVCPVSDVHCSKPLDCKKSAEKCVKLAAPQPLQNAVIHIEAQSVPVVTAHRILDELIDIYDDGNNNAPEDRCYVEGAWREVIDEARAYLKAPQSEAQSVPISERLIAAIEGECDGLAITGEQASNILAYLQYGAPMDDVLKDAQRYRKLRDADIDSVDKGGVFVGLTPNNVVINGEDLDIAVDLLIDAKEKS